jgi:hypothetical protein
MHCHDNQYQVSRFTAGSHHRHYHPTLPTPPPGNGSNNTHSPAMVLPPHRSEIRLAERARGDAPVFHPRGLLDVPSRHSSCSGGSRCRCRAALAEAKESPPRGGSRRLGSSGGGRRRSCIARCLQSGSSRGPSLFTLQTNPESVYSPERETRFRRFDSDAESRHLHPTCPAQVFSLRGLL